jgi:transcriptional regulator with XRE-family HTH domain
VVLKRCRYQECIGYQGKTILVQKLRLQRGWSQEQLAELSGLSARTIQRMESGSASSPESLKAIGSVFEIDWSKLKDSEMIPDQATVLLLMRHLPSPTYAA